MQQFDILVKFPSNSSYHSPLEKKISFKICFEEILFLWYIQLTSSNLDRICYITEANNKYIGCFKDAIPTVMPGFNKSSEDMTIDKCVKTCASLVSIDLHRNWTCNYLIYDLSVRYTNSVIWDKKMLLHLLVQWSELYLSLYRRVTDMQASRTQTRAFVAMNMIHLV